MIVGVPEGGQGPRVPGRALIPAGVHALATAGHEVLVQAGAGAGAGIPTTVRPRRRRDPRDSDKVWGEAEMVMKVKEPVAPSTGSCATARSFTLTCTWRPCRSWRTAAERRVSASPMRRSTSHGRLPLLTPMCEVAGRIAGMSVPAIYKSSSAATAPLLGRPGRHARGLIIVGGGVVGINSAKMASGSARR